MDDENLRNEANVWLQDADLEKVTINSLIAGMEERFGCSLAEKKSLFKEILNSFFMNFDPTDRMEENVGEAKESSDSSDSDEEGGTFSSMKGGKKGGNGAGKKSVGGGGGGFSAPVQLSTELSELLHAVTLPRTQVIKQIWAYIRERNLQNPEDRREILCDDKLENLFKRKKVNMFTMQKYLASHMKKVRFCLTSFLSIIPLPLLKAVFISNL